MENRNEKDVVRIELTPEQQEQVKRATGRNSVAVELTIEELEERIAPSSLGNVDGITENHNETLLVDR